MKKTATSTRADKPGLAKDRDSKRAGINRNGPPPPMMNRINKLYDRWLTGKDGIQLSDAYRDLLRTYVTLAIKGKTSAVAWLPVIREALSFLGGQPDRHNFSLKEYDHNLYGPYLGVSDEGSAAMAIRRAAYVSPKARTLGRKLSLRTLGLAIDAERLGGIGEIPVGPDEYADIWSECADRLLISTNVGSHANLRLYNRAPIVVIASGGGMSTALENAKTKLVSAFKPFLEAPGGARPLVVFVEFEFGSRSSEEFKQTVLRSLVKYVRTSGIAAPPIHKLGLNVRIGWGKKGFDSAIRAINLASSSGIEQVSIDGVVRKEADTVASFPGLLNYLPAELITPILLLAQEKRIHVSSVNVPDPDSVARDIWTGLNAARAMGLNLGKYGLFPLSLEECDCTVEKIQQWFPDWTAAPVFFLDQGIISSKKVYVGENVAEGVEVWLRVMAKHKVQVVLIDTVDKSKGWKILKTGSDPKGILTSSQIAHLDALGQKLDIKLLWAGGISLDQVLQFGSLGVFGIYVTTAVSTMAPVQGTYLSDPGLSAEKEPTFAGVVAVKSLLEAGFLMERLKNRSPKIHTRIKDAGLDPVTLSKVLPEAWRFWLKHNKVSGKA